MSLFIHNWQRRCLADKNVNAFDNTPLHYPALDRPAASEFGLLYKPADSENVQRLKAARIIGSEARVIEGGYYGGGWMIWKNAVNELFTVKYEEPVE